MREGAGMVVSLVGVLLLTRLIGPANYGVFAAAMGVYLYLFNLSQWGIGVYLIRGNPDAEGMEVYQQAFTLLLLLGIAAGSAAMLVLPLVQRWVGVRGFEGATTALLLVLPIQLTNQVPLARLERQLDYRRVAMTELSGQITYYGVALPAAYLGAGYWSPVIGWASQQVIVGAQLHVITRLRLAFRWDRRLIREMLGYGLGYSAAMWIWQLRNLVNPLIVGRFVGAAGVGYVALAVRVTEYLCFVKTATYRISIATLGRVQNDFGRLRRAVSEGMTLQQLVLGPLLAGFALVGPVIIPRAFGARWTPVLDVYPFIAFGYLANAAFALHASTLFVLRRNWDVARFHIIHIALFATAALILVPRFGIVGYGFSELMATPSYYVLHRSIRDAIGSPRYGNAFVWLASLSIPLLLTHLSYVALLAAALPFLWSPTRAELSRFVRLALPERVVSVPS